MEENEKPIYDDIMKQNSALLLFLVFLISFFLQGCFTPQTNNKDKVTSQNISTKDIEIESSNTTKKNTSSEKKEAATKPKKEVVTKPPQDIDDQLLSIYVLPTERSDAIVLKRRDKAVLFGAGNAALYNKTARYLKEIGIDRFELVILPIDDDNEIGAISYIAKEFKINEIWLNENSLKSKNTENAVYQAKLNGARVETVEYGKTFSFENVNLKVINPQKERFNHPVQDSTAIKVEFVDFCMVIFSNSNEAIETKLVSNKENLNCQVLKASQHGAASATSSLILDYINPEYVIFTTDGSETSPQSTTLERISLHNSKADSVNTDVYMTHINGRILIKTDGKDILLISER